MYNRDKIIKVLHDIKAEADTVGPYVLIAQPRRDKAELPAQNFNAHEGLHIDLGGFSHAYADIEKQPIDVARNYLCEVALNSGAKYLLFVDEDTVLPWYAFNKLHEVAEAHPGSIVSGVYYIKISNPMIMEKYGNYVLPADVTPGRLIYDPWQIGFGCCLIPIEVLQKIKDDDPEIPFCCVARGIDDLPFIGEDNFFFHRARKLGIQTIVTTDVQCLHIDLASGQYTAHPNILMHDYITNVPITTPFTMADKKFSDLRWQRNFPKPEWQQQEGEITNGDSN